jgi:hypothetical protein
MVLLTTFHVFGSLDGMANHNRQKDFPYYTARSVPAIYTITTDLKSYLENKNIRQLLVRKQGTSLQVANRRISLSFSNNFVQNNFRNSELHKS